MSNAKLGVVGLGDMGGALARSFLKAGIVPKVWNRSPDKAQALQDQGAIAVASAAEAIEGCSAVVVCLSNYSAWAQITDNAAVRTALSGVTVIQLTGGTLTEVQENADLMAACGADLIEGAILCFPEQIGTDDASIIVAGPEDVVAANDGTLRVMSPEIRYLGDNYSAPIVLGRAAISSMLALLIGTVNGAALCRAGGVPMSAFRDQVAKNATLTQSESLRLIDAIAAGNTEETQASLLVWADGQAAVLNASENLGVETAFHDGIKAMFDKAIDQGLGEHDLSAMVRSFT
jgi:3-hydroxyisobutyrate dehydrogenase-like beta-hydroxyacid dehydrogenase